MPSRCPVPPCCYNSNEPRTQKKSAVFAGSLSLHVSLNGPLLSCVFFFSPPHFSVRAISHFAFRLCSRPSLSYSYGVHWHLTCSRQRFWQHCRSTAFGSRAAVSSSSFSFSFSSAFFSSTSPSSSSSSLSCLVLCRKLQTGDGPQHLRKSASPSESLTLNRV